MRLPGPGWTGFVAAAATAIGLAASTIGLTALGAVAGLAAAAAYLYWLWSMDRALPRGPADAGRGLALPLYRNDGASAGSWGIVVLLVSDVVVIASFVFAYLFLWTARPVAWPPDGSRLPGFVAPAVVAVAAAGAWLLFEAARRLNRRDRRGATALCLGAAAMGRIADASSIAFVYQLCSYLPAIGLVVYAWSRQLFGSAGGIVSVALFAVCPTLLAIGPLVTSDTPVALFFAASAWARA